MFRHASVGHQAVDAAGLPHSLADRLLNALRGDYIGLRNWDTVLHIRKFLPGLHQEYTVFAELAGQDLRGAQANAADGTGDGDNLLSEGDLPAEVMVRHGAEIRHRGFGICVRRSSRGGSGRHDVNGEVVNAE